MNVFDKLKLDKVKKLVGEHAEQLDGVIDKAAGLIDEKTGGKYAEKIGKGAGAAKGLVDKAGGEQPPA